jgi:hypothetical protein
VTGRGKRRIEEIWMGNHMANRDGAGLQPAAGKQEGIFEQFGELVAVDP